MKVLFVCTANSCRSQMAEAWARRLFPAGWSAASAGIITHPIDPRTRWVMDEAGVDMRGQQPKTVHALDRDAFDLVITLSGPAARYLPPLADPQRHRHAPLDDPMAARGDAEQVRDAFRAGRDRLRELVTDLADGRMPPPARR